MAKQSIPDYLKNQVEYYSKDFLDLIVVSANQIDRETIRVFYNDKENRLTSKMFPYLTNDKIETAGVNTNQLIEDKLDNGDKFEQY